MKDNTKKIRFKNFFKSFKKSFVIAIEMTALMMIISLIVGFLLFSWAWGLNKAFIYKDIFFVIIPIMITLVFLAIATKLEDL